MQVEIYCNLNNGLWSVRALEGSNKGKVIGHAVSATVIRARFVVRTGGRLRVLREGQKNVHAFVRGELDAVEWSSNARATRPLEDVGASAANGSAERYDVKHARRVVYSPYRHETFVDRETLETVTAAPVVCMTSDRKCCAFNPS